MEINTAFRILEIERTKDEDRISGAYRTLLHKYNPEDDAEGFKNLRLAYETALNYARTKEKEEEEDAPQTELDIWMKKIETLYNDILSRGDISKWKQLLSDDICVDLDTSIDARVRILVFLLDNSYLPHAVWKEIDDTFQISADITELENEFPSDFLEYVKYNAENESFMPYELFEYISLDGEDAKPDAYIRQLFSIKRKVDEGKIDGCMEELDNLKDYDVYHPYEDAERLKIYIHQFENHDIGDEEKIKKECQTIIDRLEELPMKYIYAHTYAGEAMWYMGQKEAAYAVWNNILEERPDAYRAKFCIARYWYEQGQYEKAAKRVEELSQSNQVDDELYNLLIQINEELIKKYRGQLERGEENSEHPGQELKLELGWKLWQNEHISDAIELIESFEPDEKHEYGYNNLFGRLLYHNKEYKRAISYLRRWKELLWKLEGLDEEETKIRLKRRSLACSYIGSCLYELSEPDAAEENLKQAVSLAETKAEKLQYMQQYAAILLKWKRYNDVVDVCDDIIKMDAGYYPAYLMHQEACFELKKGQEVVDDYRSAVQIVSDYYKPYMYAALVYYYYGQYQDGLSVLRDAHENNIDFTSKMMLIEVQILRRITESDDEREKLLGRLYDVEKKLQAELTEAAKEDSSDKKSDNAGDRAAIDEIYYERALLYRDMDDCQKARIEINKAIKAKDDAGYHFVKGDILSGDNYAGNNSRFAEAIESYKKAEAKGIKDNPWLYFSLGYCYERLDNMKEGIRCYEKALSIQAPYENICERLVDYYLKQYSNTHDKTYIDKAMKYADIELKNEESGYSLWLTGKVYENGTEFHKAVELYKKGVELSKDDYILWQQLGNCYRRMMDYEQAEKCLKRSIEKLDGRKRVQPYINLAICYEAMAEYEKAIQYYKQSLEFASYKESIWQDIGDCYRYLGEYEKAMKAYQKADKRDMDSNYAEVLYAKGDYKKAEQYYKKTVQKIPKEDMEDLGFRYVLLGDFYLENFQNYKKALACYEKSKNADGGNDNQIRANVDMVKAYYMSGKYKKAQKCAEAAMAAFQREYSVSEEEYLQAVSYQSIDLYRFGWIYLGLGDVERAKTYFKKMEEGSLCKNCKHRGCYEAQLYLGVIYFVQGDIAKARKAFEEAIKRNPHDAFSKQMLKKTEK